MKWFKRAWWLGVGVVEFGGGEVGDGAQVT